MKSPTDAPSTTNLVSDARHRAKWGIPDFHNAKLLNALADEIDRLRGEIAQYQLDREQTRETLDRLIEEQRTNG